MNYNEMNPRHRIQAEQLAAAVFTAIVEPTRYRLVVELHTEHPDHDPSDPDDDLHALYLIEGATIDTENEGKTDNDFMRNPDGLWLVEGMWATCHPHRHDYRRVNIEAVTKWVLQMITRDRVREVRAELY